MLLLDYANELRMKNPTRRIIPFEFDNQSYIIKQPEQPSAVMRWLKGSPQKAFQREVDRLKELMSLNAPIPKIYQLDQGFILMENGGQSVRDWLKSAISNEQKQQILNDAAKALAQLHEQNLVHGRPYSKDILWKEGKISFIDFEASSHSKNLTYNKIRDNLLFIYGLCCENVPLDQIRKMRDIFAANENREVWQKTVHFIEQYKFVYYLLLPFKFMAKKDLKGVYGLFQVFAK
ncbi:hypothetical protein B0187_07140 [Haemophilus paracuniculus]|uniref:Serine/threonine protein kinase n=1 Tax=Haemophilus paracuniculus TaxID=734 RepID=A0A1T0AS73_9PAST|nr:lipopolysaccharide kinase InaA family protein [Haemophilus paracuniculus]OOR99026.1 hypothetical protein B0187_07140 [Haemophilus paracuniculus]